MRRSRNAHIRTPVGNEEVRKESTRVDWVINCEVISYVHTRTSKAENHTMTDKTML